MTTKSWVCSTAPIASANAPNSCELDFIQAQAEAARYAKMPRMIELDAGAIRPVAAIFDVMGKALLARIEIDGCNALTRL